MIVGSYGCCHMPVDSNTSHGLRAAVQDVHTLTPHAPNQDHRGVGKMMGVEYDNYYCRLVTCHCGLGSVR